MALCKRFPRSATVLTTNCPLRSLARVVSAVDCGAVKNLCADVSDLDLLRRPILLNAGHAQTKKPVPVD